MVDLHFLVRWDLETMWLRLRGWGIEINQGGIEAKPGTEKRCSHNLQSGPVKTWTAVFVIINISDRR